ncbi:hypothetical protein FRC19_008726 [Serendipita sp. 401]|nr:hypothetical protein FRC19_008726 [Serendipita sp. 401]KAG9047201.1 hypothetical protein FS842_000706 [Serendipita sp. 407]
MANLQLSNNMSGLSDHFILCKAMGDVPEDPCLLLRRDISFDEALDQIHRHWSLNVSLDTCDWKPDSPKPPSPHTDQYTLKHTIEIDSFRPRPSRPSEPSTLKLPFQHCSIELFVIGGGITARLLGLSWDMLRSKSIFNVIYWRLRPPRAIKAAGEMTSTTPMITAKAAATRATKGNIAGGEEDGMN